MDLRKYQPIKVAEVFNILSTSQSTALSDELTEIENYCNDQSRIDTAASAKLFDTNDTFTESNGDLVLDDEIESDNPVPNSDTDCNDITDDIDPAEALKSLSNLKKYKIH